MIFIWKKNMIRLIQGVLALVLLFAPLTSVRAHDDAHQIIHLMKMMFDTPENPLSIKPVVIKADYAIAGWVQGNRGGRALLKRQGENWKIHLCAGDALKEAKMLEHAGIDQKVASELVKSLEIAENGIDRAILAKFATFEGIMMVDGSTEHSAHGHHGTSTEAKQSP